MNSLQMIAGLICGSGLLILLLSIPMILRRVPPNSLYGVRTKASFSSDSDWYRINAIGGRYLAVSGTAIFLVGGIGFFIPSSAQNSYLIAAGVVSWLAIVAPCIRVCSLKPATSAK